MNNGDVFEGFNILKHEPQRPVRASVYGEGIFVGCWQRFLDKTPEFGIGEENEQFNEVFASLHWESIPRDAMVAASFMCWLGTNVGGAFILHARDLASRLDMPDAFTLAWARQNMRHGHINCGRRTIDVIVDDATTRDLEVVEHLVRWLGSGDGQRLLAEAEAEMEATRVALIEVNRMRARAQHRALELAKE